MANVGVPDLCDHEARSMSVRSIRYSHKWTTRKDEIRRVEPCHQHVRKDIQNIWSKYEGEQGS